MQELERDRSSTGVTWGPTYRKIQDLEELAKEVGDIEKKGLTPRKANKALKDLMKRKGHLLKKTNTVEVDVPEQ